MNDLRSIDNDLKTFKCRILENESEKNEKLTLSYEKFRKRMAMTKGARFEASRRHKFRARTSQYTLIILSLFVFFIGVVQVSFPEIFTQADSHVMNAANIFTSAGIMVLSLLESGRRHELRSELFLRCAQAILEIEIGLDAKKDCGILTFSSIMSAVDNYNKIMSSFSDNHSDYDFELHRAKTLKINPNLDDEKDRKLKMIRKAKISVEFHIWLLPIVSGVFIFLSISLFLLFKLLQ